MRTQTKHDYTTKAFEAKRKTDAENYKFICDKIEDDRDPNKVYKVVSLPGPVPTWEDNLQKAIWDSNDKLKRPRTKLEFHGVESDATLWAVMVGEYASRGENYIACEYNERTLEDFIRAHRDFQADIVYMDFLDGTSECEWKLYDLMVEYNFLAEDAIIMSTMYLKRVSSKNLTRDVEKLRNVSFSREVMRNICDVTFIEGERPGVLTQTGKPYMAIPKLVYSRLKKSGFNVEVKSSIIYRTRSNPLRPNPMIQILCQRKKDS